ncbi:DUF5615 family PIN-like protein [Rhizobium leguminosarum]|uniref:DUF5615 family PIN-like protein n=1 Tax=Rhizobium leguminosarum TaxID=384 RepID=UPI00103FD3ED|nr:DUF5615 family PIN-like protein [Rhizobium leguminosarum]TBZ00230.1 hypothetical protein E0H49_15870 [Rhizobium leguminosarum bv. viciae]
MRFFLDASVPDSVGNVLAAAGHEVIFHRDALADRTKDPVVCQTALANEAILVAVDKDMRQLTKRFGVTDERFKNLPMVFCGCSVPMSSARISQSLSLIQHEWDYSEKKVGRRLLIEISNHHITTQR